MSKKLSLKKQLEAALRVIAQQAERIAELERQLGLNSKNSSKAPSTDGVQKAAIIRTQSLREKTGKKVGGQPGHKGSTLNQVENPDVIKKHEVTCCPDCKIDLTNEPLVKIIKRQVFDVPEIKPYVTEHQFAGKKCPSCKKNVEAQYDGINAPVQYGNTIKALVTYLNAEQLIPQKRIASISENFLNMPISVGTVESIVKEGAILVKPSINNIESELKKSSRKNADETWLTVEGKTFWDHSLSNDNLVHHRISEKRGDVPKDLVGIVVHDHFSSYFSQMKNVTHALCNAHHLRQLTAVKDLDKEYWAELMMELLLICNDYKKKFGSMPSEWINDLKKIYFGIIDVGIAYHEKLGPLKKPPRGKVKNRHGFNLLQRLKNFSDEVLRFITDPKVPFTNNEAERSVRMIKVKQKISGGFRTLLGAQSFLDLKSYIETTKKNNMNVLHALIAAFESKSYMFSLASENLPT